MLSLSHAILHRLKLLACGSSSSKVIFEYPICLVRITVKSAVSDFLLFPWMNRLEQTTSGFPLPDQCTHIDDMEPDSKGI